MQIIFDKITLNDFIQQRFALSGMLPKPAESLQTTDTHAHAKRARTRIKLITPFEKRRPKTINN